MGSVRLSVELTAMVRIGAWVSSCCRPCGATSCDPSHVLYRALWEDGNTFKDSAPYSNPRWSSVGFWPRGRWGSELMLAFSQRTVGESKTATLSPFCKSHLVFKACVMCSPGHFPTPALRFIEGFGSSHLVPGLSSPRTAFTFTHCVTLWKLWIKASQLPWL